MQKKIILASSVLFLEVFLANTTKAVCPVCIVAVGAGFGFSRWLKIDDLVSSIWVGAFIAAVIMWTLILLRKKNLDFKYISIVVSVLWYLLILLPLYFTGIIGHPLNKIFGIDKIMAGTALGSVIFLLSLKLHKFFKIKNNGKSFFPFQKVILPVAILTIASILFFILIKWATI